MEKEIEIRAKIIKAIKSNASPNAITRYWEMSTDDIEQAAAEIFEALNPTSDSKREPSGERKQIIELRHWSEQKEDYIDAVVCGVNCDCSDLECKF